ncbi:unnamed protein product [Hermetia illucens]|uniref:Mitochondrial-processing peptidase subunit alpha n=1 Tax=Hermetia illucens TaxID=343691 RepID=A0A7R8UZK5_HERIL|nr:mitochondrial-processing peptidase subunit alpha [Hermetia illucens]CAD7089833.1 unnamed protein product [Hermetia illucens]
MAFNIHRFLQRFPYRRCNLTRNFATDKSGPNVGNVSSLGKDASLGNAIQAKDPSLGFPPLSQPLPGLPEAVYATPRHENKTTQVTTLSNGLKVASEDHFGQFCTIGVVINSGPRYEVAYPSGVSHFLEKLAFHSTVHYDDKDLILKQLENHGGICDCQSSRDTFIYAASADSRGIEPVTRVLADVVLRPKLSEEEVNLARQTVQFELESLRMRPEQEPILMDMIHAAGYRENTLGLPKICPEKNLEVINRNVLMQYLKNHHTPDRMVVAGVGVKHDELVKYVEKYFINEEPIWKSEKIQSSGANKVDTSLAQYTGGLKIEECDIPIYAAAGLPELAHIVIGLEGCSHQDDDFIPACVLNIMMGGGGSFSAGGPGKGMYTRLYTNVLNRYHWMFSATAYNHAYADTGLFCIHASAPPANVREMTEVITRELVSMASQPDEQELRRAKTQLQSMLLMNLETRPVVFEDIGRQVLATGSRNPPKHYIDAIGRITSKDIQRIARRILSSPPSVAARGDIKKLPDMKDIQAGIAHAEGRMPNSKRLTLFR